MALRARRLDPNGPYAKPVRSLTSFARVRHANHFIAPEREKMMRKKEEVSATFVRHPSWQLIPAHLDVVQRLGECTVAQTLWPQLMHQLFSESPRPAPITTFLLYGPSSGCNFVDYVRVLTRVVLPAEQRSHEGGGSAAAFEVFHLDAEEMLTHHRHEAEKTLRVLFEKARDHMLTTGPAVVLLEHVECLSSRRGDGEGDHSRRIKTEFLVQLSDFMPTSYPQGPRPHLGYVVCTTDSIQHFEKSFMRRIERALYVRLPTEEMIESIMLNEIEIWDQMPTPGDLQKTLSSSFVVITASKSSEPASSGHEEAEVVAPAASASSLRQGEVFVAARVFCVLPRDERDQFSKFCVRRMFSFDDVRTVVRSAIELVRKGGDPPPSKTAAVSAVHSPPPAAASTMDVVERRAGGAAVVVVVRLSHLLAVAESVFPEGAPRDEVMADAVRRCEEFNKKFGARP